MTDDMDTNTVEESAPNATMGEVSHGNPYTGQPFGDGIVFDRGPTVAADGGERNAVDPDDEENEDEQEATMKDVDHEHPDDDSEAANRVFERGKSGDDEAV